MYTDNFLSQKNCHISAQNLFWIKLSVPVKKKLSLMSLCVKFYEFNHLQALLHSPETSIQNCISSDVCTMHWYLMHDLFHYFLMI